jgi:hypothetical protein
MGFLSYYNMDNTNFNKFTPLFGFVGCVSSSNNENLQLVHDYGKLCSTLIGLGGKVHVNEVYMESLKNQVIAWKPYNHNSPIWAFDKVSNNQAIGLD